MKFMRKTLAAVLAVVMLASMLLMSACSTPKVAMTVDGREYTTGEFLAALYTNYTYMYQSGLYQYVYYGLDPWTQTFTYGEGDAQVQLLLADYLLQITQDDIARQTAVKKMMEQYAITVSDEDKNELTANLADVSESELLKYGFNKASYYKMALAGTYEESTLFYTLYGEGGQRAIAADEVRKYFDENFIAYKAITLSQMDSSTGEELPEEDQKKNEEALKPYLELFKENGDMDAVITKYNADEQAKQESTTTTTTTTGTGSTTTTTTAATTTTTTAAETTTTTGTGEGTTEEEEESDPNLVLLDSVSGDGEIVKAILEQLEEGECDIITYTDGNGDKYIALVQRLDVEEAGGENYYDDQKETCIYGMKFEEFNAEVKALAATLVVTVDDRAMSMCDPQTLFASEEE